MQTKAIFAALAVAVTGAVATPGFASQTCKDVYIAAVNNTGKQIKVIDMHFKMRNYKTKSEPIKNSEVPAGRTYSTTRNLEKAAGRDTKVTVVYRVRKSHSGFDQWTSPRKASSGYAICGRYSAYEVNIKR